MLVAIKSIIIIFIVALYVVLYELLKHKMIIKTEQSINPRGGYFGILRCFIAKNIKLMFSSGIKFSLVDIIYLSIFVLINLLPLALIPFFLVFKYNNQSIMGSVLGVDNGLVLFIIFYILKSFSSYFFPIVNKSGSWLMFVSRQYYQSIAADFAFVLSCLTLLVYYRSFDFNNIVISQIHRTTFFYQPVTCIIMIYVIMLKSHDSVINPGYLSHRGEISEVFQNDFLGRIYEYVETAFFIIMCMFFVICFMGGYLPLFGKESGFTGIEVDDVLIQVLSFLAKTLITVVFFRYIKSSFSRFNIKKIVEISWNRVNLLALVNFLVNICLIYFGIINVSD